MRRYILPSVLASGMLLAQPALAQPAPPPDAQAAEEERQPLDCSVTAAFVCKADGCSKTETFGELKLPSRLLIHFDSRVIASVNEDGLPHVTPIATFAVAGEGRVIQGVDGATGWMIHLSKSDEKMTFTLASHQSVLTGAGACKKID